MKVSPTAKKRAEIAKKKGVSVKKPKAHQSEKEWQKNFIG